MIHRAWILLLFSGAFVHCGSSAPPPPAATPPPAEVATVTEAHPTAEPRPPMHVEGQLGSIDPAAVDATFNGQLAALQRCHVARLSRVRALGGDVTILLRIGEDGHVRYAYPESTSLGDHATEQCLVGVLSDATWPKPSGGEAEIKKSFGFAPPTNVRAPVSWSFDDVKESLAPSEKKIHACRARVNGVFNATAYIAPGPPPPPKTEPAASEAGKSSGKNSRTGGKKTRAPRRKRGKAKPVGHIVAVGIAPPGREGAEAIECLVGVLTETPMPNPGPRGAKVSFWL